MPQELNRLHRMKMCEWTLVESVCVNHIKGSMVQQKGQFMGVNYVGCTYVRTALLDGMQNNTNRFAF